MATASDVLNRLRDAISEAVDGTRGSRGGAIESLNRGERVTAAVEECLSFQLLPRNGNAGLAALWSFLEAVDWDAASDVSQTPQPMPRTLPPRTHSSCASVLRHAAVTAADDAGRVRQWIMNCLDARLLRPACAHLCGPRCTVLVEQRFGAGSILRDRDTAARFLSLVEASHGLSFRVGHDTADAGATSAHAAAWPASVSAEDPKAPTTSLPPSVARDAAGGDDELLLAPGHEPLHAFWDDLTVAAERGRNNHDVSVRETCNSGVHGSVLVSTSSVLGDAAGGDALLSVGRRVTQSEQATPQIQQTTSAWDFSGSVAAMLSLPFDALRRVIGSAGDGGETAPEPAPHADRSSVFGIPLASVVHDPHHCVHALLDYRLAVPEIIHVCSRMLWDLAQAARPDHATPPAGLGIVSPPTAEVLALAETWDATRSLPLPLAAQDRVRPVQSASKPAPWELQAHTIAQLLRYYILRLPQCPIDSERSVALAEAGALPHSVIVLHEGCSSLGAGAVASPRVRRLRVFVSGLPIEVRALLCELLPLLGWMCGVSPDGEHWGGSAFDQAHLAALSHIWAAALVAPPPFAVRRDLIVPAVASLGASSSLPPTLEAHVRGTMQAVACLVVYWRFCLSDLLEERASLQAALLRRLHRLTVTHKLLCAEVSLVHCERTAPASSTCDSSASGGIPTPRPTAQSREGRSASVGVGQGCVLPLRPSTRLRPGLSTAATLHTHTKGTGAQSTSAPNALMLLEQVWTSLQYAVGVVTTIQTDIGFDPSSSPFWRSLGFQTGDPVLDASRCRSRSLGLLCFAYMSQVYQRHVWTILAHMHGHERAVAAWGTMPLGHDQSTDPGSLPVATGETAGYRSRRVRTSYFPFATCVLIITRKLADALHLAGVKKRDGETGEPQGSAGSASAEDHRVFSPLLVATADPDFWAITASDDNADPSVNPTTRELPVAAHDIRSIDQCIPESKHRSAPADACHSSSSTNDYKTSCKEDVCASTSHDSLAATHSSKFIAASPVSMLSAVGISLSFACIVCLASFILEARWRAGGPETENLPQLVVLSVQDALAMLPQITAGMVASNHSSLQRPCTSTREGGVDVSEALRSWSRRFGIRVDGGGVSGDGDELHGWEIVSAHDRTNSVDAEADAAAQLASPRASLHATREHGDTLAHPATGVFAAARSVLTTRSSILSDAHVVALESELPKSLRGYDWTCVYSLLVHGASAPTLLLRTRACTHTLIVILDSLGGVFGGFAGDSECKFSDKNLSIR